MNKKCFGFTLAEIMVTMTIVGVIAALTIPTLYYQRTKKEYSAKLKNFYSRMNNAIMDRDANRGSFKDIPNVASDDIPGAYNWYMENIDPYFGHSLVDPDTYTVYFQDGSSLRPVYVSHALDLEILYDVNGDKGPNQFGFDRFLYLFAFTDAYRESCFGNSNTNWGVYCPNGAAITGVDRAELVRRCAEGTEGYARGTWCTKLLQNDQWEFKSDYPLKF